MLDLPQELMTPDEAARWFRRSASWLRHQPDIVRVGGAAGQPLYHVQVCRAYVLGRICGLTGEQLRRIQIKALAAACDIPLEHVGGDDQRPPTPALVPLAARAAVSQDAVPRVTASASPRASAPS